METQNMSQVQTKQLKPLDEVRNSLDKMVPQFKLALPSHIPAEKFTRVVMTAVGTNPRLLEVNRASLYSACMKAAQDGLLPDGRDGAIVEFKGQAQWMPMVAGILKKVRNSGEVASIHASIIYANELSEGKFNYWIDSEGQHIEHRPILFGERGKAIGVYAMAKTKDGSLFIEPLGMADIEKIKSASRSANGPWATWWEEMAKKSAIRRLAKRLPQSTDIDSVLKADEELFTPEEMEAPEVDHSTGEVVVPQKPARKPRRTDVIKDSEPKIDNDSQSHVNAEIASNQESPPNFVDPSISDVDYEDVI